MIHFLPWLHILGIGLSFGTGLFFVWVFLPSLKVLPEPADRMRVIGEGLRYFHPLFLLGLCITFMSGAMRLMDWKDFFFSKYPPEVITILWWKFGVTMLIFLIAGGQCIGMGLKLGRMAHGVIPGDIATQERLLKRIKSMLWSNLILITVGVYLGLKLVPLIYSYVH